MGGSVYVDKSAENKPLTGVEAPANEAKTEEVPVVSAEEVSGVKTNVFLTGKQLRDILNGLSEEQLNLEVCDQYLLGITQFIGVETHGEGVGLNKQRLVFETTEL